jgi:DNA-binding beta-propeller fold protein YncE
MCFLTCAALAMLTFAAAAWAGGYQVASTWGQAGADPGQLAAPKGAAVGADGRVYVVDYVNDTLVTYDAAGSVLAVWGGPGSARGKFDRPSRVALGPDGTVYVTDAGNQRIQRFSADGSLLDVWGSEGRGPGEFRHPRGIGVGPDGTVYVTDQGNARVQAFSPQGRFLRAWGAWGSGRGRFRAPKDVSVGPEGRVFVVDAANDNVQAFTGNGRWLATWGGRGSAPGRFCGPRGIVVGPDGRVYVADAMNHRIQEFTPRGAFVRQWGCRGSLPGQFWEPRDLAPAPDGGLVVVDTRNARLQRFLLNPSDDVDPPRTRCDRASGWYRAPITVSLQAADAGSGIGATYERVEGGRFRPVTTPLELDAQGAHRVGFLSVDGAGNQEPLRTRSYRLDWTRPLVLPRRPGTLRVVAGLPAILRFSLADALSPACRVKIRLLRDGAVLWTRDLGWRRVSPSGRPLQLTFVPAVAPGRYIVRVRARDRAGNLATQDRALVVEGGAGLAL